MSGSVGGMKSYEEGYYIFGLVFDVRRVRFVFVFFFEFGLDFYFRGYFIGVRFVGKVGLLFLILV